MNHKVFGGFFDFLIQANVIGLALGLMLGNAVTEITGHLIDDIVFPILKPFLSVLQAASNRKVKLPGGMRLNITSFSKSFLKFSIMLILVGLLVKISGMSLAPPVMAVKVVEKNNLAKVIHHHHHHHYG